MTLTIDFNDILRATLDDQCGNEGYIGISPDGRQYHVVVPVDLQIARGIKAGNRPLDGTPLEGIKTGIISVAWFFLWRERVDPGEIQVLRISQAKANALLLKTWAAELTIDLELSHWPD